ncbi:GMC oxidoreductase [Aureobasidium subglaciale EXF-2481]|uniref:GMC oxidoreductase n=1 Tax=Aureobasidium subglaciale (strain EXF-2481) TaxID=1043005 RepID=A0A074YV79_AURSE|nr:GMC oxidoreductase [Aureobasidium subglaciale EXF-2481]KER00065.1 GMC oxidoreductase [Aureobasidium subglaciale EXF-2481]
MCKIATIVTSLTLFAGCYSSPFSHFAPHAVVHNDTEHLRKSYNYIVIGGGTSGLVVANRLTENPRVTVLVIEYGYVDGQENGTAVPGLPVPGKYLRTDISIPQSGLNNRTAPLYTGAVVGGGTVVNGMFFARGSRGDYDAWEQLGNPGWGWDGLLPYFKKSETFTPPTEELQEMFPGTISSDLKPHGIGGPVGSSFSNYQYPVIKNFFAGWKDIGIKINSQPNDGNATGAFYSTISAYAKNQSRSHASNAYYRPIAGVRKNFHLITGHTVTKINFSKDKRAVSVDFISRETNKTSTIKTDREIILAAGAARSPQILQLSGIGPKKLLSGLGIKTIADLPGVGMNFQDQPTIYMQFSYNNYTFPTPDWMFSNASWAAEQLEIYYKNRTGPMTIPYLGGSSVAFLPLQNITSDYHSVVTSAASINISSLLPTTAHSSIFSGYRAQSALLQSLYLSPHAAVTEIAWEGGNTLPVAIIRPFSRGSIYINTTNPLSPPIIDFNTFSHPTDLAIALASVKKVREWISSSPMRALGTLETFPGANITSDAEIETFIRDAATSSWQHPTSTTSMMKRELGGVVDPALQVYGTTGLRVVDAGVFPMAVAGHSSSSVYAVAEKVSGQWWFNLSRMWLLMFSGVGGGYHQGELGIGVGMFAA